MTNLAMKALHLLMFLLAVQEIHCRGSEHDDMKEITSILREIEVAMIAKLPDHAKNLGTPATPQSIDRLTNALSIENEALNSLYKWHNGGIENYFELIPGGNFCSIETALELRRVNSEIQFLDKSVRNGLPIIYNLSGDMYFAEVSKETVSIFKYTVGEKPKPVGSLLDFLRFILNFWRSDSVEMENELFLLPTKSFYNELEALIEKNG